MSKESSTTLLAKGLNLALVILVCDFITEIKGMPATENDPTDDLDEVFNDKVEIFKRDVLHKLGYARPPKVSNVTKSIEENRRMIQQYKKYIEERNHLHHTVDTGQNEWEEEEEEENKIKSKMFYPVQYEGLRPRSVVYKDWMIAEAFRFYFENLPTHPTNDQNQELKVESAKLRVYVKYVKPDNLKDKHTVDKTIRVNAYQILSIQNKTTYSRTLLDSILVNMDKTGWIQFDISKALQSWIDNKESNLGIELAADSQDIHEVIEIETASVKASSDSRDLAQSETTADTAPVLHVYAHQRHLLKRVKRRSRRRGICRRKDKEEGCCRYPIKINFNDIGWSWILAPLEYKGYYCAGSCSYHHKLASTFAGVKVELHRQKPKKVPAPCCHAAKLSPFTILYFDEEKERYTFTEIADLIVEQCKCG